MRFVVCFLRRKGRIVPKDEPGRLYALTGDLRIEEHMDARLRRHLRVATLRDPNRQRNEPHLLYDVYITAMNDTAFTLSGFERVDDVDYVQSWLIKEWSPF